MIKSLEILFLLYFDKLQAQGRRLSHNKFMNCLPALILELSLFGCKINASGQIDFERYALRTDEGKLVAYAVFSNIEIM